MTAVLVQRGNLDTEIHIEGRREEGRREKMHPYGQGEGPGRELKLPAP